MRDHMANSKPYISFVLLFTFLLSCQAHKHSYNDVGNNLEHPTLSQDLEEDWRRGNSMPNRMSLHRYDSQWAQPTPPIAKRDHHAHWIDYYRHPTATESDPHTYSVDYHRDPPASESDHHRDAFHGPAPHPDAKPSFYTHSTTGNHRHGFQWAEPPPPETKSDHHADSVDYGHGFQWADPPPEPAAETKSDHHAYSVHYRHGFQWANPPPEPAAETKSDHQTYSTGYQRASFDDMEPSKNYEDGTATRHRKMMKPSETGDINVVP